MYVAATSSRQHIIYSSYFCFVLACVLACEIWLCKLLEDTSDADVGGRPPPGSLLVAVAAEI